MRIFKNELWKMAPFALRCPFSFRVPVSMMWARSMHPTNLVTGPAGVGDFNDLYFAKCIYVCEDISHPFITPNSVHIHVGGRSRRILLSLPTDSEIQRFQGKLFFYRFVWHDVVAASKFQVSETKFRPEVACPAWGRATLRYLSATSARRRFTRSI
jgi:hypothetical protein